MSYLGYRGTDADTDFGRFFDPEMAPLPAHVVRAREHGPQAAPVLPEFDEPLGAEGHQQTENGYGRRRDGGYTVAVRTDMPGVTAQMWDWWFGWHGCDARRYKLWHPRAHVSARWRDGRDDIAYVGRTSLVQEYLGSEFARVAVQFVDPAPFGHGGLAICARTGSPDAPVDVGWLVHQIRPVAGGAEMRSRFYMGGRHCAQEMNHLAGFLPQLYAHCR